MVKLNSNFLCFQVYLSYQRFACEQTLCLVNWIWKNFLTTQFISLLPFWQLLENVALFGAFCSTKRYQQYSQPVSLALSAICILNTVTLFAVLLHYNKLQHLFVLPVCLPWLDCCNHFTFVLRIRCFGFASPESPASIRHRF